LRIIALVEWPRDDAKLDRVRALMGEHDFDALVVRAPDNVLYLSNFWPMKGYDVVVFPREGEPILIALEASLADAERMAWTGDVRLFAGYHDQDPRPPQARALELAQEAARDFGRVGLELSLGTQASDRMVGEPTTYTQAWFDAFPVAGDATPLLAEARAIKTEQELERMRIANQIASAGMVYAKEHVQPGMRESEAAALWEGFVHSQGTARDDVDLALGFSLVWSGPGIRTFTATGDRPVQESEPTLFEIWVCADGYWCDYTKNVCPGTLTAEYDALLDQLLTVYAAALDHCKPGASLAQLDALIRAGIAEAGYPGQPTHPVAHGVGARAHEPPYAHQAGGGTIEAGMVLAIEPGIYWEGGGGLRVEDNFLITADGAERLGTFPDDFR
jgi:Xaa-Pro aminopeptidase